MGFLDRAKAAKEAAGAMGGMKNMMGAAMPGAGAQNLAQLAQKLKASGVEASGTVTALDSTGKKDFGGGQEYSVGVSVTGADGQPYDTTITQSFQPTAVSSLSVGTTVSVKYDPDNPSAAVIYSWG
jgi:Protein of unknown function (DUF3592)